MFLVFVAGIVTALMFVGGAHLILDLSGLFDRSSLEDRLCRKVLRAKSSAEERIAYEAIIRSDTQFGVSLYDGRGGEIAWNEGVLDINKVGAIEIMFYEKLTLETPRSQVKKSIYHPVSDPKNVRILMDGMH